MWGLGGARVTKEFPALVSALSAGLSTVGLAAAAFWGSATLVHLCGTLSGFTHYLGTVSLIPSKAALRSNSECLIECLTN